MIEKKKNTGGGGSKEKVATPGQWPPVGKPPKS